MQQLSVVSGTSSAAPTPREDLGRFVRRYINARKALPWKVNQPLQHVERSWAQVNDDPLDPTNNAAERMFGLTFKIRGKTMRGLKSRVKIEAHARLSSFLRCEVCVCRLGKVLLDPSQKMHCQDCGSY